MTEVGSSSPAWLVEHYWCRGFVSTALARYVVGYERAVVDDGRPVIMGSGNSPIDLCVSVAARISVGNLSKLVSVFSEQF